MSSGREVAPGPIGLGRFSSLREFFRWSVEISPVDHPGDALRDGANLIANVQ